MNTHLALDFEKAVFIVGISRSGTTMLWNIMIRLPEFAGKENPPWIAETSIFKKFISQMRIFFEPNVWPYWYEYYAGNEEFFDNFLVESCRSFLVNGTKARGASRILEKTPTHIDCLDLITKTFPDASIVHIFRHPIDIYSSMRKRARHTPPDQDPWLRYSIEKFSASYKSRILSALDFSGSIIHVKYETLTRQADKEVQKICDLINSPFSMECLKGEVPQIRDAVFPLCSNVPVRNDGNWKGVMTEDEVAELENRCEEIMGILGYERFV